jgi:hypothetical protein
MLLLPVDPIFTPCDPLVFFRQRKRKQERKQHANLRQAKAVDSVCTRCCCLDPIRLIVGLSGDRQIVTTVFCTSVEAAAYQHQQMLQRWLRLLQRWLQIHEQVAAVATKPTRRAEVVVVAIHEIWEVKLVWPVDERVLLGAVDRARGFHQRVPQVVQTFVASTPNISCEPDTNAASVCVGRHGKHRSRFRANPAVVVHNVGM